METSGAEPNAPLCAQCGEPAGVAAEGEPAVCAVCGGDPLLDGRYRLDALLGEGGAGVTYRATRLEDGRAVCVKELATRRLASFEDDELFRREADVLRQLHHPQIPAYLDSFVAGVGKHRARYLVQELVDGRSLRDELADHRYTEGEALDALDELLAVLEYLEDLRPPVVHRDVKPSNIMRRAADGRLVLVDFGAVKDAAATTLGGATIAGTLGYMAPEQLYGQADARSDLYGAGTTILALLSRRDPAELMDGGHGLAWRGHVTLSAATEDLLAALLAPAPEDRPASAREARALVRRARAALDAPAEEAAAPKHAAQVPRASPTQGRQGEPKDDELELRAAATGEPLAADDEAFVLGIQRPGGALFGSGFEGQDRGWGLWLTVGGVAAIGLVLGLVVMLPLDGASETGPTQGQTTESQRARDEVLCAGPCQPLTVPFKTKLRFGMTVDQAKAARKDLRKAPASPGEDVTARATGQGLLLFAADAGRAEAPGPVVRADMALAGYPAHCTLSFYGPGETLSALACTVAGFRDHRAYGRALDKLRGALERRYGAPEAPVGAGDGVAEPATLGREDLARWEGDGASLTLRGRFEEPLLPFPTSSGLTLTQETRAHRLALRAAVARAEADRRRRQAARAAEEARENAEEAARLKALAGDEEL